MPDATTRLDEVLSCAANLIARDGFERASIRAISEHAGLSQAGLYHYFLGKEHLLYLIQKHTFSALRNSLAARLDSRSSPVDKLRILIQNHLEFFTAHMDALRVCAFEYNKLQGEYYREVREIRRDYFRLGHKIIKEVLNESKRDYAPELNSKRIALYLFGALNWIHMWFDTRRRTDISAMVEELLNMVVFGIAGDMYERKK